MTGDANATSASMNRARTKAGVGAAAAVCMLGGVAGFTASQAAANIYSPSGCEQVPSSTYWSSNCSVGYGAVDGGAYVAAVQSVLTGDLFYTGCYDASFGSGTYNAVKAYQTNAGLISDGLVGTATWSHLRDDLKYLRTETPSGQLFKYKVYGAGFDTTTDRFEEMYVKSNNGFWAWQVRRINGSCGMGTFKSMDATA